MGLRDRLRRLRREAEKDVVVIHQLDGSPRVYDRMFVMGSLYLARLDVTLGCPLQSCLVLTAYQNATPRHAA